MFIDFCLGENKAILNVAYIVDIRIREVPHLHRVAVQMRTFYKEQEKIFNFECIHMPHASSIYDALSDALRGVDTEFSDGRWVRSRG